MHGRAGSVVSCADGYHNNNNDNDNDDYDYDDYDDYTSTIVQQRQS